MSTAFHHSHNRRTAPRNTDDFSPRAPMWIVTYGEFMTILVCFFVMLAAMGEINPERFRAAAGSLRSAFGSTRADATPAAAKRTNENPLVDRLAAMCNQPVTDAAFDGATSFENAVQLDAARGELRVVFGGEHAFDPSLSTPRADVRETIENVARLLASSATRLEVRGHAGREANPADGRFSDPRDLSYARALAIANELERHGVPRNRMLLVAAGDAEPVAGPADPEHRRALNRRVEVIVTPGQTLNGRITGPTRAMEDSFSGG